MSEPGERTARYEPGIGSRRRSDGPGVSAEDRDTAAYAPVTSPSGADVHDDGDRAAQYGTPDESAGPQSGLGGDAVDDTSDFERPAPMAEDAGRARFGATVSQRLSGSAYATAIWIGVALAAAGLGAIAYASREIAKLTSVAEQMPYLASGSIGGLVLVIAGAVVAVVAVRRRDSREHAAQIAQMTQALAEVRQQMPQALAEIRTEALAEIRRLLEAEQPHRDEE